MPHDRIRILLVEDEERREKLFRKWLPNNFILVWARSAGQALGILQRAGKRTFAGILLDHDLDQSWRVESDANLDGRDVVAKIIEKISWDQRSQSYIENVITKITQTALRNVARDFTPADLISDRIRVTREIFSLLEPHFHDWGLNLRDVTISREKTV